MAELSNVDEPLDWGRDRRSKRTVGWGTEEQEAMNIPCLEHGMMDSWDPRGGLRGRGLDSGLWTENSLKVLRTGVSAEESKHFKYLEIDSVHRKTTLISNLFTVSAPPATSQMETKWCVTSALWATWELGARGTLCLPADFRRQHWHQLLIQYKFNVLFVKSF